MHRAVASLNKWVTARKPPEVPGLTGKRDLWAGHQPWLRVAVRVTQVFREKTKTQTPVVKVTGSEKLGTGPLTLPRTAAAGEPTLLPVPEEHGGGGVRLDVSESKAEHSFCSTTHSVVTTLTRFSQ